MTTVILHQIPTCSAKNASVLNSFIIIKNHRKWAQQHRINQKQALTFSVKQSIFCWGMHSEEWPKSQTETWKDSSTASALKTNNSELSMPGNSFHLKFQRLSRKGLHTHKKEPNGFSYLPLRCQNLFYDFEIYKLIVLFFLKHWKHIIGSINNLVCKWSKYLLLKSTIKERPGSDVCFK